MSPAIKKRSGEALNLSRALKNSSYFLGECMSLMVAINIFLYKKIENLSLLFVNFVLKQ